MKQRTKIALAVMSLLAAPGLALAQEEGDESTPQPTKAAATGTGNVNIYGKLYPQFVHVKGSGATGPGASPTNLVAAASFTGVNILGHNEVNASNSRIGFRGEENLGNGLKAIWQIEQTVAVDAGGTLFASRDSFAGVAGGFGVVKLGNMDTVYKNLGIDQRIGFLGITSGNFVSTSNVQAKSPFGASSSTASANFHLRRANSVQYFSPNMAGFQVGVQYSTDESRTATREPQIWSYGVRYENGGLYLALGREEHEDLFAGSNNAPTALSNLANANATSKDTATRATIIYRFGGTTVFGEVSKIDFDESGGAAGRFANYNKNNYALGLEHKLTPNITLAANYARAQAGECSLVGGAPCSTAGLEGKMYDLGAEYRFSKRTALFTAYGKLNNGRAAVYKNLENGTVTPGMDITQWALGINHTF